jgi:TonB family protein
MWKLTVGLMLLAGMAFCQESADKVYRVGNGVKPPAVLQKADPAYTQEASTAKIEGTVLLSVTVGADGVARDIKVVHSLEPGLDTNAVAAVEAWKFQPGTKDGQAVAVKATIEVNFRLK